LKRKGLLRLFGAIFLAAVIAIPFAAGCAAPTPAPAPAPAPTPEKVYKLTYQSYYVPNRLYDWTEGEFLRLSEKLSGGRIQWEEHVVGEVVGASELIDAVRDGVLDVACSPGAYYTGRIPATMFSWSMGMHFENLSEMMQFHYQLQPRCWEDIYRDALADFGVHLLLSGFAFSFGEIMSTVPIDSLDDFNGLKLRSFGACGGVAKQLGASIISTSASEIYTALSLGTIDATMWSCNSSLYELNLMEIAKHYTEPPWVFHSEQDFLVNPDVWNELPADLQEILVSAARRAYNEGRASIDYRNLETRKKYDRRL